MKVCYFVLFLTLLCFLKITSQLGTHGALTAAWSPGSSAGYQTYTLAGVITFVSSAAQYLRDFLCFLVFTIHYTCDGAEQNSFYLLPSQGSIERKMVHMSNSLHPAECEAEVPPPLPPSHLYSQQAKSLALQGTIHLPRKCRVMLPKHLTQFLSYTDALTKIMRG